MVVAKRQGREKPENRKKEGPRTRVRTSGKTNSTLSSPVYIRQAQEEVGKKKKKTDKKRGQRAGVLSLSSLCIFWVSVPSCLEDVFPLFSK